MESGILGIQFKGSRIPSTIVITETRFDTNTGIRNPVHVSWNPQRGIQKIGVPRFGQMVNKNQDRYLNLSSRNRVYHAFVKFSSIYQKRLRKPETGIEDGLQKWQYFPTGTFRPEKQDYLSRHSAGTNRKVVFHLLLSNGFSRRFW